jgi:hypothetical protein
MDRRGDEGDEIEDDDGEFGYLLDVIGLLGRGDLVVVGWLVGG